MLVKPTIDRAVSDSDTGDEVEYGEESSLVPTTADQQHSISVRINLRDEKHARTVYNALVVDQEPKRSSAKRELHVDGTYLLADISGSDAKYLQKSTSNFFDMCELSKSVIDAVESYKYKE